MKWVAIISLIALAAMLYVFFTQPPEIIIEERPVVVHDTVMIAAPPDTVRIDRWVTKRIISTITDTDTVFIDRPVPVYLSRKNWSGDYYDFKVSAYALAPVDSFQSEITIRWSDWAEKEYLPKLKYECPKKDYKFWLGFTAGTLVTGGSVYLAGKLK